MAINFPSSPSINDTYQFNNLVFVYDGNKWKVDGQLSYIQDAIQYVRRGVQADRPSVTFPSLYYNTTLGGLELYYPETGTWEIISTFAKQVDPTSDTGQVAYTNPGTYSWVCPANVFQVHVVCVGGGGGSRNDTTTNNYTSQGGAGGGLGWKNNITVVPGQSYTVVVGAGGVAINSSTSGVTNAGGNSYFINTSTVAGFGGQAGSTSITRLGGTYVGTGGGNGGASYASSISTRFPSGGGGAGGYTGNGGDGAYLTGAFVSATAGSGGAAGGGGQNTSGTGTGIGAAGGGVGILGAGANGAAGTNASSAPTRGGGGSGGVGGTAGVITGGEYGGGAGSLWATTTGGNGAPGAVRLIWGPNRAFPSTNTGNL